MFNDPNILAFAAGRGNIFREILGRVKHVTVSQSNI